MRLPGTLGEKGFLSTKQVILEIRATRRSISKLSEIKSRVLVNLHSFVCKIYYEKQFDNLSESIFEDYKRDVDTLIGDLCGEVLEQIPLVMSRLADGDQESISQALTTCRRIIDSFADAIFPPTQDNIEISGNQLSLGANQHQNRINAFVHQHTESKSRKKRIKQNLSNLYDRVSTGVHNKITAEEARGLFLNTYLLIGEVLHLQHK